MLGRRSITVAPMIENPSNSINTIIERHHRIWLKLIMAALIPLMIGVFTITNTLLQQKLSRQQREQDKYDSSSLRQQSTYLADNLQKETTLVSYLNDVSKLLISENDTKILIHIRIKTLTSLRQLDSERKRYLLLFLYESELIYQSPEQQTSSLLNINKADFNGIQFNGTNDNKCIFIRIYLYDVYLSNSSFIDCYIDRSNFSYSTMYNTLFFKGLLIRISFKFALLDYSCFCNIKLSMMSFHGASLVESNFIGSIWDNGSVDFTNTNLTGAKISNEQLKNSTLDNCILPNKTWGPIRTKNLVINGDLQQNCTSNDGMILYGWNISNDGEIRVFKNDNESLSKCYFRTTSFNNSKNFVYMVQYVNLENYTLLISTGNARYHALARFQCFGDQYATIIMQFIDKNGLRDAGVSNETVHETRIQTLEFSNILRYDTRQVRILITIFRSFNKNDTNTTIEENYCACYNVRFLIVKKIEC